MKKALAAVFIVVLASAGIFFAFFRGFLTRPYAERVFPEDTIFYASLDNVERARKNLEQTAVWKQLSNSPRKEQYRKLLEHGFRSFENASGFDPRPIFKQFKGEVSLAVFPLPEGRGSVGFIGIVKNEKEFRQFLEEQIDPALKRRFPEIKKNQASTNGVTYYQYNSPKFERDVSPCYFISGHRFIFSLNDAGMRHMIGTERGKFKALKESEPFRKARKEADYSRGVLVYINVPAGLRLVEKSIPVTVSKYWSGIVKLSGAQAVQAFVYTTHIVKDRFEESGFLQVNRDRSGLLKIYMDQPPQKMESLDYMPSSMKMVSASSLPDFAKMWDELNAQLGKTLDKNQYQQYQQGLGLLRGLMNFDLRRDLMEPVGDEFAFSYEPGSAKKPLNINYLVIVRLRNPDNFRITVSRVAALAATRGIVKREASYRGRTLQVFSMNLPEIELSPSYTFEGKWFLFASNEKLLQSALDGKDNGDGIRTTAGFKETTSSFPGNVHAISYTNVSAYLRSQAEALRNRSREGSPDWIGEYDLDQELLELSKVLSGNATYTKIEKDGIRIRGNSSVPSVILGFTGLIEYLPQIIERYVGPRTDL